MTNTAVRPISLLVAATYLVMVAINGLANALPINGIQTGDVSDAYPNLFAPAGYAFSIWGVIYLLLLLHVLYQFGLFRTDTAGADTALLDKVGRFFAVSSLANAGWILAWHFDLIALSVLLMLVILASLAVIVQTIRAADLNTREKWLVAVPFSVYFGWITVATVANITVFLVSLGWDGFGLAESTWAVIILLVAAGIGTVAMLHNNDLAYGAVLLWAFTAILVKHRSADGFAGEYPQVAATVVACLVVFVVAAGVILVRGRRRTASLVSSPALRR
ncbi:lantibiotic ABC transporter permease [Mycolicibacterium diernhoferi]|nr:lantibiotic ABC transporter permease [Mycolicibacterium diernhoferi]PEG55267.1 lantibiotic ABC transporter permease [Mycolicibacterium diernhoferi]QYL21709.1 tryptophan-rich sensory protein [Mycolicibacterium diernhoferi]